VEKCADRARRHIERRILPGQGGATLAGGVIVETGQALSLPALRDARIPLLLETRRTFRLYINGQVAFG
jgi:hypothetical protein